jgi:POT family proton-dependent oligopeptide transporter
MVVIGASLMAVGHFMMAFESLFLLALLVLILGNGAFKPNISTQVGTLYAPGDPRRDRAFSIFYVGINLGAFLAPLVCGTLGEELGWHYGFGAAGVGMTIGLAIYLYAAPTLPRYQPARRGLATEKQKFDRDEWRALGALILLALPVTFFWATYEQQGNTIALWADGYTDRTINLIVWAGQIPVTWFQAFNLFAIFAFHAVRPGAVETPGGVRPGAVVRHQDGLRLPRRRRPGLPDPCSSLAALSAGGGKASWPFARRLFRHPHLGELYLSPTGLSLVTKVAPPAPSR